MAAVRRRGPGRRHEGPQEHAARQARPAAAAPLQEGRARLGRRHRAARADAGHGAEALGARHLHRLLAAAGGLRGDPGPARVHRAAPRRLVVGALDQRGRPRRPRGGAGARREVPAAPAGDRGRAARAAASQGAGLRGRRQLPGAPVHHHARAGAARGAAAHRAGEHLRRPPHRAHLPGDAGRRVGPDPAAHPHGRLGGCASTTRASSPTR